MFSFNYQWAFILFLLLVLQIVTVYNFSRPTAIVKSTASIQRVQQLDTVMQSWLGNQWALVVGIVTVSIVLLLLLTNTRLEQNVLTLSLQSEPHSDALIALLVCALIALTAWAVVNTYNEVLYMNTAQGRTASKNDDSSAGRNGLTPEQKHGQQQMTTIGGTVGLGLIIVVLGYFVIKNLRQVGSDIVKKI